MRNMSMLDVDFGGNGSFPEQNCGVEEALKTTLAVTLALVIFSMGCSVKVVKVWFHMKRPWAILVGLMCQFGLMPLIAYLLAQGFSATPIQAVAIIIMGSSPGGIISNMFTYWLDGDMDLSVTMTSISSLIGLGTMPLWLYVYTRAWIQSENMQIPYLNIGIMSISLIIPVVFGVLINYKWPKVARIILRTGSVVGGLLMLAACVYIFVSCNRLWSKDTTILTIGAIFPPVGFLVGFVIAVIFRQPYFRCRTIAMETGAQNTQVCGTILPLFFPSSDVVTLPIMYACFQILIGFLLAIAFQTYKVMSNKKYEVTSTEEDRKDYDQEQTTLPLRVTHQPEE